MHTGNEEIQFLESALFAVFGQTPEILGVQLMTGGTINTSVQVETNRGSFFVKWNDVATNEMFRTEVRNLELLRRTDCLTLPQVVGQDFREDKAYLILEFIESAPRAKDYWTRFGQSLAQLHSHTDREFGLEFDNYIGSQPQRNARHRYGTDFFIEERLKVQAGKALYHNRISPQLHDKFERLYRALPDLLPRERPALVHGDLWSGNVITDARGQVALVDPATHYGQREAELSYTHLFGGFDPEFYAAYDEAFPLEPGFQERIAIYNLYPLLVHVNIFGKSYVRAVEKVLDRF